MADDPGYTDGNLGLELSNTSSPDHHKSSGWPSVLDDNLETIDSAITALQNGGDGGGGGSSAPPLGLGANFSIARQTLASAQVRAAGTSPPTLVNGVDSNILVPVHAILRHNMGDYQFGPQMHAQRSSGWIYTNGPGSLWYQSEGVFIPGLPQKLRVSTAAGPRKVTPATVFQSTLAAMMGDDTSLDLFGNGSDAVGAFEEGSPLVLSAESDLAGSGVTAASFPSRGAGYAVGDTGTLWGIGNGDATYVVTSVGDGGTVTGITITAPGSGYNTTDTGWLVPIGSQPGAATTFAQVLPTAADGNFGNGTLDIWVVYYQLPLS
jgi:hypothetical protein